MASVCPKLWAALAILFAFVATVRSHAAPSAEAKTRAADYQAAARAVFTENHWTTIREGPGRFTAIHDLYRTGANFNASVYGSGGGPPGFGLLVAQVTVTFTPQSATDTSCQAHLALYVRGDKDRTGQPTLVGPLEMNDGGINESVQGWLASARRRLIHQHPEYGVR